MRQFYNFNTNPFFNGGDGNGGDGEGGGDGGDGGAGGDTTRDVYKIRMSYSGLILIVFAHFGADTEAQAAVDAVNC